MKIIIENKKAINSILILVLGTILGAGSAFMTQVIIARNLEPYELGIFSSALATINLVVPLAIFGIDSFWLKAFGEEGWGATRWLSVSYIFVTLCTLLFFFLVNIWAFFGPNDTFIATILLILSFYIFGQVILELVKAKLQLEERYLVLSIWQSLPQIVRLLMIISLLYVSFNIKNVAYVYAFVSIALFLVGVFILLQMYRGKFLLKGHYETKIENHGKELPTLMQIASLSWPFGLAGLFYMIYFQSDIILLNYIAGAEAAGIYNVAYVIIVAIYLIPGIIYQKFLLPKIHRWAYHEQDRFYQTYRFGNMIMLGLGLSIMLSLLIAVPWLIPFLFGENYHDSIFLLKILALAIPIRFLATSIGATLNTKNHIRRKVKYMAIVAILNIILNLILIPVIDAKGAAIATVISETVLLIIYAVYAKFYIFNNKSIGVDTK